MYVMLCTNQTLVELEVDAGDPLFKALAFWA